MKTHRVNLRVEMNNKDDLIMHLAIYLYLSKYSVHYPIPIVLVSKYILNVSNNPFSFHSHVHKRSSGRV